MIFPQKQVHSAMVSSLRLALPALSFPEAREMREARGCASSPGGILKGLHPPSPPTPERVASLLFSPRCKVRGCVFPASEPATGMCHFHNLEVEEPAFFESFQPIRLVLDRAKYGFLAQDSDNDRFRLRRLKGALRKTFLEGAA